MSFALYKKLLKPSSKKKDINVNECLKGKKHIFQRNVNCISCIHCGMISSEILDDSNWVTNNSFENTRCQQRLKLKSSIHKEVKHLNFDENIVELANEIYQDVIVNVHDKKKQIFRGKKRKAIIFSCIMHAFKLNKKQQNYETIMKLFNISKKFGLFGMRYLNMFISKKYKSTESHYVTPTHVIDIVMNNMNATESQKQEVFRMYDFVKDKSCKLNRSRPSSVANAIVYFWMKKKKIKINTNEFSNVFNMSELTINKLMKEIERIYERNTCTMDLTSSDSSGTSCST